MAELPGYLYSGTLARPRGVASPPPVGRPQAQSFPTGGGEALGRGLQQVGGGLAEFGIAMQAAQVASDYATGLSAGLAALEDTHESIMRDQTIPPLERSSRFVQQAQERVTALLEPLAPAARAQVMAQLTPRLQAERRQLFDTGHRAFVTDALAGLGTVLGQLQRQELAATTNLDRATAQDSQQALIQSYVTTGFLTEAQGVAQLTKLRDETAIVQAQTRIQQDPMGALEQFAQGPTANGAVPPAALPALIKEAEAATARVAAHREARMQGARRQLQEEQAKVSSGHDDFLLGQAPTIPQLLAHVDVLRKDRQAQRLDEVQYRRHLQDVRTLIDKQQQAAQQDEDVPVVSKEARLRVDLATTPQGLQEAGDWIRAHAGQLKSTTLTTLLNQVRERTRAEHPLNDHVAQEAQRLFRSGAFPGGLVPAILDKIDDSVKARLSTGGDLLNQDLMALYTAEGLPGLHAKGEELGRKYRDLYFTDTTATNVSTSVGAGLPPAIKAATSRAEAMRALAQMGTSLTTRQKLDIYRRIDAIDAGGGYQPPPAPPKAPARRGGNPY